MVSDRTARRAETEEALTQAASWRTSLGESGILGFVVGAVKNPESPKPLKIHSLRLIGNSVADTGSITRGTRPGRMEPS